MTQIIIRETTQEDLKDVMALWNNGDVTKYVGFPEGIGVTLEELEEWLKRIKATPHCNHYCIFTDELGYCGETFYAVDKTHDLAALDIKLFNKARGKGIAYGALANTLDHLFVHKLCSKAYVDPNVENIKAWELYKKLGFEVKERPEYLEPSDVYLEISRDVWLQLRENRTQE